MGYLSSKLSHMPCYPIWWFLNNKMYKPRQNLLLQINKIVFPRRLKHTRCFELSNNTNNTVHHNIYQHAWTIVGLPLHSEPILTHPFACPHYHTLKKKNRITTIVPRNYSKFPYKYLLCLSGTYQHTLPDPKDTRSWTHIQQSTYPPTRYLSQFPRKKIKMRKNKSKKHKTAATPSPTTKNHFINDKLNFYTKFLGIGNLGVRYADEETWCNFVG